MKTFRQRLALICCLLCMVPWAQAAGRDYAVVDSVQMPAWVQRNGIMKPLAPGDVLQNRDHVLTGDDARVVIQLAEGSAVKLGENAQLDLNALGRRDNKVFTAALDVARGAFRFTTGVFSKAHDRRAINVRIATITAGIRGTDLWGSSDAERDLVCLLEGRITVMHAQDEAREMNEPLSFYIAPKGQAPGPIAKAEAEQIGKWAAQTEVRVGGGYAKRDGQWKVLIATTGSESEALALYDAAREGGFAARIAVSGRKGNYLYTPYVGQLPSREEASAAAVRLLDAIPQGGLTVAR